MIAKQTAGSEYDSWSDLEENFARAYEPIPLHINMETWRGMSKRDILKAVRSRRMRKELEYLTHSEILGKIEVMQKNAKQLSSKFGVDHLLPHMDHIVAQVHREDEQNPQIKKDVHAYMQQQQQQHLHQQHQQQVRFANKSKSSKKKHDSWSSRASSILNNPESIYVSREEVLKNLQNDHNHRNSERNSGRELERGKQRRQQQQHQHQQKQQQQQQQQHGSWSSRASSILASAKLKEPLYMSRAEIIENLADAAYDALSRHSSSMDSDSDASTVKSVILNKKRQQQQQPQDQRPTMSGETDDSKFPPNPYMGESDTCSCTSCELYYMGDGYCSTCDGDYGEYNDDDIYGGGSGNGNLTYTKGASIYDVRTKEPKESARNSKNPAQNSTSSKVETRRGSSSNDASIDGGKSKAAVEAAGRDKGKRNGSVSSNEGSKVNMNRDHRESGRTNRERNSGKSSEAKISSSESARTKRFSVSSSAGSDSKKVSTKTTSAASSFSSRLGGGGSRRRSQEIVVPIELDPNSQRDDDSKFPPKQNYGAMADLGGSGGAKIISGDEEIYRAVGVGEIQRQKNERVLRRHLRDLASDWNRDALQDHDSRR